MLSEETDLNSPSWNDPLNWHSRDGHTLRERNTSGEKKAIFPEVSTRSCRADEDLRKRR
jgi:hypothetical protein